MVDCERDHEMVDHEMVDCERDHDEMVDWEIIDDLSISIFLNMVRENKKMIYFDMKSHI